MSSSQTILHGNLGKDPEIFRTTSDFPIATFSLATTRRTGDGNGGSTEVTDWHNVKALGKSAELAEKYLQKGKEIIVFGHNETREYDKDGSKRYITEIVVDRIDFCGSSQNQSQSGSQNSQNNRSQNNQNNQNSQNNRSQNNQNRNNSGQGNSQSRSQNGGGGYNQNNGGFQRDDEVPY